MKGTGRKEWGVKRREKLETREVRKDGGMLRSCGEWRERDERGRWAGGEDKGRAEFPDVASVLFAAPAPRITAFTLQLKNSPRDNLFSWSAPSCIVFPENGSSPV